MKDKNPLILWVDDDFSLRILAERVLLKAGFDCITAGSGQEALVLLNKLNPDLILLDVDMPGMNGFDTCSAIRKHTSSNDIPILMATCHDDINSIGRAYEVGATDFMTKPLNWKLLVYRIQYMLRSDRVMNNLKNCKSRLRNLQRIAQIGTWEWNNKAHHMYCSPEARQLFGWNDQQNITYQLLLDSIHPDDKDNFIHCIKEATEDWTNEHFSSFNIEHRIMHTDGSVCYVYQQGEVSSCGTEQLDWITAAIREVGTHRSFAKSLEANPQAIETQAIQGAN